MKSVNIAYFVTESVFLSANVFYIQNHPQINLFDPLNRLEQFYGFKWLYLFDNNNDIHLNDNKQFPRVTQELWSWQFHIQHSVLFFVFFKVDVLIIGDKFKDYWFSIKYISLIWIVIYIFLYKSGENRVCGCYLLNSNDFQTDLFVPKMEP